MRIGILGTGMVGQTIGTKLVQLGYSVKMGSRDASNAKAADWVKSNGPNASQGTFADAASYGEIVFNCTSGSGSLSALDMAGKENISDKILVDLANPLDFSSGSLKLSVCNTDSLGERIQKEFPNAQVVKTLNTVNCALMVNPSLVSGEHDIFISGNDKSAKEKVAGILTEGFGWKNVIDLGDIKTARNTEMLLPIWINLMGMYKSPNFNFKIVK